MYAASLRELIGINLVKRIKVWTIVESSVYFAIGWFGYSAIGLWCLLLVIPAAIILGVLQGVVRAAWGIWKYRSAAS